MSDSILIKLVDIFELTNNKNTTTVNYIALDNNIHSATLNNALPINIHYPTIYHNNTSKNDKQSLYSNIMKIILI